MLKQDAVPEPPAFVPPPSVAQARVTPDELAQALAAIETRRQAEAAHLAGTIPIDQAVSDLHLDATPDEIWIEVQAQRAKASAAPSKLPVQTQTAPPQLIAPRARRFRSWPGLLGPAIVLVLFGNHFIPHFGSHAVISHQASVAAPHLRSLSTIPVDQEVYADDFALVQISQGKPASQITVSQNMTGNRWPVVKKSDHHIYMRGYIERADSVSDLQGKPLNVYNDDDSGELDSDSTSNLTLRVDNIPFQKTSGTGTFSGVTISNFQSNPFTTLTPGR